MFSYLITSVWSEPSKGLESSDGRALVQYSGVSGSSPGPVTVFFPIVKICFKTFPGSFPSFVWHLFYVWGCASNGCLQSLSEWRVEGLNWKKLFASWTILWRRLSSSPKLIRPYHQPQDNERCRQGHATCRTLSYDTSKSFVKSTWGHKAKWMPSYKQEAYRFFLKKKSPSDIILHVSNPESHIEPLH